MRRGLAVAVTAGIVATAVLGVAGPASAHNQVIATTPSSGETLTTLPAEFSITTNLSMLDLNGEGNGFALEIRDAKGRYYGDGCLSIVDATMSEKAAIGAGGDYTVVWQLVSQDGHIVSGSYPFSWQPPTGFVPSKSYAEPQNCGRATTEQTAAPSSGNPDAERSRTVPLSDVLWIGIALLVVAIAVIVSIVVLGRRRRTE